MLPPADAAAAAGATAAAAITGAVLHSNGDNAASGTGSDNAASASRNAARASGNAPGNAADAASGSREDGAAAEPELKHPRSGWLAARLPAPERDFRALAQAADSCHAPVERDALAPEQRERAALAERCKTIVEMDRCDCAVTLGRLF